MVVDQTEFCAKDIIRHKNLLNNIFFFIILFFLMEIIFTYGFKQYFKLSGFKALPYIRFVTILFTVLFYIKFFLNINVYLKIDKNNILILFWFIISLFELFVGLFLGNPLLYVFSDYLYIMFGLLLILIINHMKRKNIMIKDGNLVIFNLSLVAVCLLSIFLNGKLSPQLIVFLLSWLYVLAVLKSYKFLLFFLIVFSFNISSRASLLTLWFIIMIFFFITLKRNRIFNTHALIFLCGVLSLFSVLVVFTLLYFFLPHDHPLFFRIHQTILFLQGDNTNVALISINQRIVEINLVIKQWCSNLLSFLVGRGLGATISGKYVIDKSVINASLIGSDFIHNIHVLPFTFIHKYGLLGVLLFIILIKETVNSFNRLLSIKYSVKNNLEIWSNIFVIALVIYSLPAASFLWTTPLFWVALSLKNNSKNVCGVG
jgi:hypothetical protein